MGIEVIKEELAFLRLWASGTFAAMVIGLYLYTTKEEPSGLWVILFGVCALIFLWMYKRKFNELKEKEESESK